MPVNPEDFGAVPLGNAIRPEDFGGVAVSAAPAATVEKSPIDKAKEFFAPLGIAEAGASLGTGALATPVAGLAGLGQVAANAVGLGTTSPADRVRSVQEGLTYQPKTAIGQTLTNVAAYPFQKLAEGADVAGGALATATGSPAVGAGANALLQTAVPFGLAKGARAVKPLLRQPEPNAVAANDLGLAVTPSEANAGIPSRLIEGLSGEPRLAKKMSVKNQPVVNELIVKDLGLPAGSELSRDALSDIRKESGKAYEIVRRSGRIVADQKYTDDLAQVAKDHEIAAKDFPDDANPIIKLVDSARQPSFDANSAMSKVITLRKQAEKAFKNRDSEMGRASIDVANALEEQIGRHLEQRAKVDQSLVPALQDFRDARVRIAKTYAAEKALNDSTGDINPQAYAKMLERNAPLSGEAKTVAEMAAAFPRSLQPTGRIKSTGATIFDAAAAGFGHEAPLLFVRPIARSVLSSGPYQHLMTRPSAAGAIADIQGFPGVAAAETAAGQRPDWNMLLQDMLRRQQQPLTAPGSGVLANLQR